MTNLATEVAQLKRRIAQIEKGQRISHGASIENAAVEVRDEDGSLRAIVGQQGDGTTGAIIMNGPPPPQPSDPIVASVLGGVTASWDGQFAAGAVMPLDWARIEVHASTAPVFTPDSVTLQSTIETAQGATVVIACETDVYVRLVARTTSGTASNPSGTVGPYGPTPVVATDLLDGIVTTLKLADDAVTAAKVAANAIDSIALADGAVLSEKLAAAAVSVGKIADNAVTGPAIAADAVTAGKVAADAITARELAAGSVTAAEVAAGAITTDKLTVTGGGNLLSDPGFEGPYTGGLVTGDAYWSVDTSKGNGSSKSLRVNATAGSPTNRDLTLFDMAIQPGDQLYLATDYQASTDYAGTPRIYARWENSSGGFLSTSAAQASPPVLGATWQRISTTVTAPANTARVKLNVASTSGTAGTLWFDNASVRPVAGGTQIADGAVTTQKIVAGAVQTLQLDAEAVNASKIAAGAVTTVKLDALAVTADKIAANTITAGKLAVGSVDATALKADAITGKTITGGTITGTDIIGGTVTGGILRTGTTGERVVLTPTPPSPLVARATMLMYSGATDELGPGLINSGVLSSRPNTVVSSPSTATDSLGTQVRSNLTLNSPKPGTNRGSFVLSAITSTSVDVGYALIDGSCAPDTSGQALVRIATKDGATTPKTAELRVGTGVVQVLAEALQLTPSASNLSGIYLNSVTGHTGNMIRLQHDGVDAFIVDNTGNAAIAGNAVVTGQLTAGNIATGFTSITPSAPHTPTSTTVFYSVTGTVFLGYATAYTTVPGVRTPAGAQGVTGVSVSAVTATSAMVWVNRENTTTTNINWMVMSS
ncbi:hypothetical protein [Streptomyces sp. NPDC047939]|uniref:hypothetical protein n=1 Tax=Streptomyces sp. NPDC047939 TaxID=3155381 RepID=UPI003427ADF7